MKGNARERSPRLKKNAVGFMRGLTPRLGGSHGKLNKIYMKLIYDKEPNECER